jgi:methionine-rich copper-binding protein CopC
VLAGAVLALAVAAPALAHVELVASDPANGAVLAIPPTMVTVSFSEAIDPARSRFRLVGPDGSVGAGRVVDDPAVLVLDGLDLGPGAYEIQWTVASKDGHIERGRLRFTVSAPTPALPTASGPTATPAASPPTGPGATAGPATSAPSTSSPSAGASPAPSAGQADPAATSAGDVLLPLVVAVAVVAGVGALVLRRSRRA